MKPMRFDFDTKRIMKSVYWRLPIYLFECVFRSVNESILELSSYEDYTNWARRVSDVQKVEKRDNREM